MPRPVRIAICQFASVPPTAASSVSTNFSRLELFVSSAAAQAADLIVFPEYFLTGIIAKHLHLATDEGYWVERLQALAKQYAIDIVAGTVVEKSSQNDAHMFNTARYIDKHGNLLGEYRKKNLWHPEKVFPTDKFKAGLLICWDLAWPEAFRALLVQGVEVVIVPTCWVLDDVGATGLRHDPAGAGEASWLDSLVVTRAYENECCVVFVNCGGPKSGGFLGRSSVALPFKGAVARIDGSDEEMRIVDVDLDILQDAREVYKIREDLERKLREGASPMPSVVPIPQP